jgi:hypothetical protein
MKTHYYLLRAIIITLLFSYTSWGQATIAQWNFNGTSATTVPGGVTSPTPSVGSGTASLVNLTLAATFASGNTTAGTLETETTSPPNYGWNSTGYPTAGTGSKTAGVQYNVSTVGEAGITLRFEQRLSNTAANTYVVQYTTDNTTVTPVWTDAQTFTVTPAATGTGDTWYIRSVDLSGITTLDDNPNVSFRVLSAFDPGTGDYLAARSTSTYAGGTVRYDMVTITSNITLATSQFAQTNQEFRLYPNPAGKEIVNLNKSQDVEVLDASGKILMTLKNTNSIDAGSLQSGVYFVRIASGQIQKLIVK